MNENYVKIYSTMNPVEAHMVKFLLANNDIGAIVDNDELNFFFGLVAARDAMAEIWVPKEQAEKAVNLLRERSAIDLKNLDLSPCPACGTDNCGLFDYCWKCQADLTTGRRMEALSGVDDARTKSMPWIRHRSLYFLLLIIAALIAVYLMYVHR